MIPASTAALTVATHSCLVVGPQQLSQTTAAEGQHGYVAQEPNFCVFMSFSSGYRGIIHDVRLLGQALSSDGPCSLRLSPYSPPPPSPFR